MDIQPATQNSVSKKLGVLLLTALVVGGIVGAGIFSLPQNMAENAGAGAIVIAWAISFAGMYFLAHIFVWLTLTRPEIEDGVYGYVRHGFGNYLGFNAAWGYWISGWVGIGSYLVIIFGSLGSFSLFSFFVDGKELTNIAFAGEIILLWTVFFFVIKGVHSAALLNVVITIAKILPILVFIVCCAMAFKADIFRTDFWGTPALGSVLDQVKSTMLVTVWVFLGIESATVYGTRAKNSATIMKATVYGFLVTVILLACVSILALGIVPQQVLAAMPDPSMAYVLKAAVGPWGATLIHIGLIVSVSGALLAWTLISTEMLYLSARGKDHTAPRIFGRLNKAETPAAALLLTICLVTGLMFYGHWHSAGYKTFIELGASAVLIPYWLCAAYALKLCLQNPGQRKKELVVSVLAVIYASWLIFAAGMNYFLFNMLMYMTGIFFFIKACREKQSAIFPDMLSKIVAVVVFALGSYALYLLLTGELAVM